MIYSRDEVEPEKIQNFNIVLKGSWKLSIEENSEEFIYKKVDVPSNEE